MRSNKIKSICLGVLTTTICVTSLIFMSGVNANAYVSSRFDVPHINPNMRPHYSQGYLNHIRKIYEESNNAIEDANTNKPSEKYDALITSYSDSKNTYRGVANGVIKKSNLPFSFVLEKNSAQVGIRTVAIDSESIGGNYSCVDNAGWNSTKEVFTINNDVIENLSEGSHKVRVVLYDPNYQDRTEAVTFKFYLEK